MLSFKKGLAISVQGVRKTHILKSGVRLLAIENVNASIKQQEFVTIVGPSGCGKSTLLNLMAGFYEPDAGQIVFQNRGGKYGRPNLGYISQADTLLPWKTVRENVEIGLKLRKISKKGRQAIAEKLLAQVKLTGFENNYPFELSGGMKKRVAVIRTLAYDPDIVFMDEPFVGLDVQTRDELEENILNIWQEHRATIVMVTHDLTEAITLSDRVILMTARPSTIKAEYDIPFSRPRSVVEIRFNKQFIKLQKQIWRELSAEVRKASKEHCNES